MADIDFEELDKAVNSLMSQHSDSIDEPDVPEKNRSTDFNTVNTESSSDVKVAPDANVSNAAPSDSMSITDESPVVSGTSNDASAQRNKSPLLARRQSGRFMDVVHPSSDMKSGSVRQGISPNRASSRVSNNLQPLESPTPTVQENDSQPLENNVYNSEENALESSLNDLNNEVSAILSPMESPFLTDIEVNKRPLGGAAHADNIPEGAENKGDGDVTSEAENPFDSDNEFTAKQALGNDPWSEVKEQDLPTENMTPPELSPEILALESMEVNDPDARINATKSSTPATEEPTAPAEASSNVPTEPAVAASQASSKNDSGNSNLSSGDISRQYKPSDSGAPEPSAVFAAASESPQQLTHVDKKKTGWNIVVWLIVSLLAGVIGGVLFWYFLIK